MFETSQIFIPTPASSFFLFLNHDADTFPKEAFIVLSLQEPNPVPEPVP